MKYFCLIILLCLSFSVGATVWASDSVGTIQSDHKYAWGENLGWINFKPATGGLTITDTEVTGYVWSKNFGWINFSPANGGVTNNCLGQLGGYAWSSQKGWVNLAGAVIGSDGHFTGISGTAGTQAGRINFDCEQCEVDTDWRPCLSRPRGSSSGYSPALQATTLNQVKSVNSPLVVSPNQLGLLSQSAPFGYVILDVPLGAVSNRLTFSIKVVPSAGAGSIFISEAINLVGGVFFDITARDNYGRLIHEFAKPITISLPIPANLRGTVGLAVYWLDETKNAWVKVPNVIFTDDRAIFSVDHLTRFAIFGSVGGGSLTSVPSLVLPNIIKVGGEKATGQSLVGSTTPQVEKIPKVITSIKPNKRSQGILVVAMVLIIVLALVRRKK